MTNDQAPMTKRTTKAYFGHWDLVIAHLGYLRFKIYV
jgi:hypothetical protein